MRRTLFWLVGLGLLASMLGTKRSPADRVRYVAGTPKAECDPSYPTLCIPVGAPDLDCDEINASDFPVVGSDPHGFDADHDGVGCEPWNPRHGH